MEGISHCTDCHVLGEEVTNQKCLDCHKEVAELINFSRGYHSSSEVQSKKCFECHSEHHGRNFKIIMFDENNFNHSLAGFELKGKHDSIECNSCHQKKHIVNEEFMKRDKTYMGLGTECIDCHDDYHQNTLGNQCQSCHTEDAFKPSAKFDHNNALFNLTGAHKNVNCDDCHKKEIRDGRSFQVFKGIRFSSCENCHNDFHKGKFGKDCERCHNTQSFKQISKSNIDNFDHLMTNYPLEGKHQTVACLTCHKNNLAYKPKFAKCTDCHDDYHKGQLMKNGKVENCENCHSINGFNIVLYGLDEHNKTNFKLTGSHLAIPCQSCHLINDSWSFRIKSEKCVYCHDNVHGNTIDKKYFGDNNCENCHTVNSWKVKDFDHDRTNFALLGIHKTISCSKCHIKTTFSGKKVHLFNSIRSDCTFCHEDIHRKQFDVDGKTRCDKCHVFNNWKAVNFNHDNTKFPLDGKHKNVECSKCHKKVKTQKGDYTLYRIENYKCIDCHK